jgi:carbon monoxide dehydrogenase subunit G
MKLTGTRQLDAPAEVVWAVLKDPAAMASLVPGVETFQIVDENTWNARVKVPIGVGGLKMKMSFQRTEERPIEFARLRAKGSGVGAIVAMETAFELEPQDGSTTAMHWQADVKIAGRVGELGARVLNPVVTHQVENVLTALDKRVKATAAGA